MTSTGKSCKYKISETVHLTFRALNTFYNFFTLIRHYWLTPMRCNLITYDHEWQAELQHWSTECRTWSISRNGVQIHETSFVLREWRYFGFTITFQSHTSCIHVTVHVPQNPDVSLNIKICIYTQIIYIQNHCIGTDKNLNILLMLTKELNI